MSISAASKNVVATLAHLDKTLDLDAMNYVALRAYPEALGKRVNFNDMSKQTGIVPVKGTLIPVLLAFADPANPGSARVVAPDDAAAVLGKGFRLRGVTAEVVPNGFWPIDFGGALGEPVTRGIAGKLPWLNGTDATLRRRNGAEGGRIARRRGHRRQGGLHARLALLRISRGERRAPAPARRRGAPAA